MVLVKWLMSCWCKYFLSFYYVVVDLKVTMQYKWTSFERTMMLSLCSNIYPHDHNIGLNSLAILSWWLIEGLHKVLFTVCQSFSYLRLVITWTMEKWFSVNGCTVCCFMFHIDILSWKVSWTLRFYTLWVNKCKVSFFVLSI